jgi:type VI secretion system protein VasD
MNKSTRGFNRVIQCFFLTLVTFLMIACSSVFQPQPEKVEKLTVEISTAADINPNDKGVANPLRIVVFTLKNTDEFQSSDFFTITEDNSPSLKEQMNSVYDRIMVPSETRKIELTLEAGVTAIGIVAAYREIEQADWKAVVYPLPEKRVDPWYKRMLPGRDQSDPIVKVRVERLSISIKEMD